MKKIKEKEISSMQRMLTPLERIIANELSKIEVIMKRYDIAQEDAGFLDNVFDLINDRKNELQVDPEVAWKIFFEGFFAAKDAFLNGKFKEVEEIRQFVKVKVFAVDNIKLGFLIEKAKEFLALPEADAGKLLDDHRRKTLNDSKDPAFKLSSSAIIITKVPTPELKSQPIPQPIPKPNPAPNQQKQRAGLPPLHPGSAIASVQLSASSISLKSFLRKKGAFTFSAPLPVPAPRKLDVVDENYFSSESTAGASKKQPVK